MPSQKNIFKGLKVVELASVLAGPSVGMFFAELGATVIKVENKLTGGDVTRQWKLPSEKNDKPSISAYYASVNWKKKSVFLNLKNKKDSTKLYRFIKEADIVITNHTKNGQKKLGIDYQTLKKNNPKIIQANITGYGEKDERHAFDLVLQAEAGYMSMNGTEKSGPLKIPFAIVDVLAAHQLKVAVLIALLNKQKTGKGAYVSVSLFDTAVSSLVNQASNWLMANYLPKRIGSLHPNIAPYGETFVTKDKKYLVLAIGNDKQFNRMCELAGLEKLIGDKLFATNSLRVKNRSALHKKLSNYFTKNSSKIILKKFNSQKIPVAICRDLKEVFEGRNTHKLILKDNKGGKRVKTAVFDVFVD